MQEAADGRSADGALVGLHAHYLTAVDAEAHVSAREHYCVLGVSVAHHAFSLALVGQIGRVVVDSINVIEVHDLVVVKQFLLQKLVAHVS